MRGAKPYQTTTNGVVTDLTTGQWVKLDGYAKPGRFVRYNADGTSFVLPPTGKGRKARVNMRAFQLACGKDLSDILAASKVKSRIVNFEAVGPAEDREAALEERSESYDEILADIIDLLAL
jgi:hypothetical protein